MTARRADSDATVSRSAFRLLTAMRSPLISPNVTLAADRDATLASVIAALPSCSVLMEPLATYRFRM
ncbi:hypothetical protein D3C87_2099710 [compost metagenome]